VTRGPGATNASIGVHTAFQDSTPMVLFVGDVASDCRDREAFQEVVYLSFVGIILDNAGSLIPLDSSILRILRIFRIFRILRAFRIFKSLKELQDIVAALGRSAPQVGNLLMLLMLLFFIFGVLAVNMGGGMCVDGDQEPPADVLQKHPLYGVRCAITSEGALLEAHGHFQGIGVALLTLWRVATSDGWGAIMNAVSLVPGDRTLSKVLMDSYLSVFNEPYVAETFVLHSDEDIKTGWLKGMKKEGYEGEQLAVFSIAMKALSEYNTTVTADSTGAWSANMLAQAQAQGVHSYVAKQLNADLSVASTSAATALTIDTTAPSAPGTPVLAAGSDTGTSGDNITSKNNSDNYDNDNNNSNNTKRK
jgi:hypothetical protein